MFSSNHQAVQMFELSVSTVVHNHDVVSRLLYSFKNPKIIFLPFFSCLSRGSITKLWLLLRGVLWSGVKLIILVSWGWKRLDLLPFRKKNLCSNAFFLPRSKLSTISSLRVTFVRQCHNLITNQFFMRYFLKLEVAKTQDLLYFEGTLKQQPHTSRTHLWGNLSEFLSPPQHRKIN